jgi:hypothetical protein
MIVVPLEIAESVILRTELSVLGERPLILCLELI